MRFPEGLWIAVENLMGTLVAAVGHPSSRDSSVLSVCPYWCGPEFRRLFDILQSVMTKMIVTCDPIGSQILSAWDFRVESWVLIPGE